ncbi:MAG: phosphatidate cytidylyltransferase, partial [Bacteroidota bacterium]
KTSFEQIGITLLGLVYVMLPFASLHLAVFWEGQFHYQIILGIFFIVWIHDIGAYFIGSRYGRRQLFPRISPNKSWEGTVGGAILAWTMAFLLAQYLQDLSLAQWLVIASIIIVLGTHGDLIESMLKRNIRLKDSSEILPGHGGFLDRFDNLLISAPFIALFLKIF